MQSMEVMTCAEHGGYVAKCEDDQVGFLAHDAVEQVGVAVL